MPSIRIWAVESDNDEKVIRNLSSKLANYLGIKVLIQTAGRSAYRAVAKNPVKFERQIEIYLQDHDCVIFVLDADRGLKPVLRRIESVRTLDKFTGRVHLVMAKPEIESWLLIDCIGICCYFARTRYSFNCRDRIVKNKDFQRFRTYAVDCLNVISSEE